MKLGLISRHHSCQELIPFPGIALQMIKSVGHLRCSVVVKIVGHPFGAHFVPAQSFCHDFMNTSNLGSYGFHCNSAVLDNEPINQLEDVIGNAFWCSRLSISSLGDPSFPKALVPCFDPCKGHTVFTVH